MRDRPGERPDGLGLYVHVPFCRTRCRYCDFYRVAENAPQLALFLQALEREVSERRAQVPGRKVDTIFLGGGTPSLMNPEQVGSVLELLRDSFEVEAGCEISMEANPSDLDRERLAAYRRAGVTRLSLGVQSLQSRELRLLGRRHGAEHAVQCVDWARRAGFEHLSVDLMLGIPAQTEAGFRATVARTVELPIDHVSVYLLEVHEGTEIDGLRRRRPGLFPSVDRQARRYEWLVGALEAGGLAQYEISNFARPDGECRHNLRYWRREDFLGFGPSAHSCLGAHRWSNPRDLAGYLVDPMLRIEEESDRAFEEVFLGLRLREGMTVGRLAERLGIAPGQCRARVESLSPFLELAGEDRVRFTVRGYLVSNAVFGELESESPDEAIA